MKIVTIVGARPQFIKAAIVSRILSRTGIHEFLLHTGQHYSTNMSDIFFQELDLKIPDINLQIQEEHQGVQTGYMLEGIEKALIKEKPDRVLVYGDTNSTLAGALAAAKLHIPVDHIEAGLRSFNKRMPEEINRVLTDHISDCLFVPSSHATQNLIREGVNSKQIYEVGDVMYDSLIYYRDIAAQKSQILERLSLTPKHYAVATIHRAENTDDFEKLKAIFNALDEVSAQLPIILPLHPRTKKALQKANIVPERIKLIEPISYLDMLQLTAHGKIALTDSGGFQKEAFFLSIPCITLREETEWVELVESGWNMLSAPRINMPLLSQVETLLSKLSNAKKPQLYGNGQAAHSIVDILRQHN